MDIQKLKNYLENQIARTASAAEIARKCGISSAALSQFRNGKYGADEMKLAQTIAQALGYRENNWVTVDTVTSYRMVEMTFKAAKEESMWMGISSKAGIGKTESLRDMYNRATDDSVVFIQCTKWSGRQLFLELAKRTVGLSKGYNSIDKLKADVVEYFYSISSRKPILLIDEADKLQPSALASLIDLYNRTDSFLGAILAGTERLEEKIKTGAASRGKRENFDELDSRLGREYIHLLGATEKDVKAICAANGVDDVAVQENIWGQIDKVRKEVVAGSNKFVYFVEDFRRLGRLIKTERVKNSMKNGRL